jgi:sugar phosphate isomerase/epimerase
MMKTTTRRGFIQRAVLAGAMGTAGWMGKLGGDVAAGEAKRRFTLCLSPGSIGVRADQRETLRLARVHGFESIEAFGVYLAGLSEGALMELQGELRSTGLVFGMAGLPVDFRGEEGKFREDLAGLDRVAAGLARAGVNRVGTWLSPSHPNLTYLQNLRRHATRLREIAKVLGNHGARLGLEYVGPRTSLNSRRYPFVHTLAETRDLIAAISHVLGDL